MYNLNETLLMEENTTVHCPKCNSTQITADKKGFSGKKAVAGAVLTGGIGLLAGTIGSNKVKITCLACGHVFKPGDGKIGDGPMPPRLKAEENSTFNTIFFLVVIALLIIVAAKC
jgi:hypothetical protein